MRGSRWSTLSRGTVRCDLKHVRKNTTEFYLPPDKGKKTGKRYRAKQKKRRRKREKSKGEETKRHVQEERKTEIGKKNQDRFDRYSLFQPHSALAWISRVKRNEKYRFASTFAFRTYYTTGAFTFERSWSPSSIIISIYRQLLIFCSRRKFHQRECLTFVLLYSSSLRRMRIWRHAKILLLFRTSISSIGTIGLWIHCSHNFFHLSALSIARILDIRILKSMINRFW